MKDTLNWFEGSEPPEDAALDPDETDTTDRKWFENEPLIPTPRGEPPEPDLDVEVRWSKREAQERFDMEVASSHESEIDDIDSTVDPVPVRDVLAPETVDEPVGLGESVDTTPEAETRASEHENEDEPQSSDPGEQEPVAGEDSTAGTSDDGRASAAKPSSGRSQPNSPPADEANGRSRGATAERGTQADSQDSERNRGILARIRAYLRAKLDGLRRS